MGDKAMLRFICGRIRSGKTTHLIEKIKNNPDKEALLIVPEQYSHSIERLLCEICGNSVSEYAEVTSFRRLASKVKSEVGGLAAEIIGGGERILMLRSALGTVAPALGVLSKSAKHPDQLERLLSAIDEFKAYGVTPEKLAKTAGDLSPRTAAKMQDLAMIYAAYEKELGGETFDAYDELMFTAENIAKNNFFKGKTLYFDGFSGFTYAEFEIISAALSQADEVYISLEIPEVEVEDEDNGIFNKGFETKKRIIALAERAGCGYDEEHLFREESGALRFLDRSLYSPVAREYEGDASEICIARADGTFAECELCAAYILDGVREKGMRFRDFSVAVTSGEEYIHTCRMVFSRYGIPAYSTKPSSLISKPAVAIILAAFECIVRGFGVNQVMEYIKTGFTGITARSLDIFENYLYTWSPRASMWSGGREFTKNPLGLGCEESDESRELLRIVNRVRKKIYEPIEELRRAMQKGKTGEKCAEALYDFINRINLPRRCNAFAYMSERIGRLREVQEYERIPGILYSAIDSIGRAVGNEETDIEEFYMLFRTVISQDELDTIPASLDCVSIGEVGRAEGERCRIRMILGANDGVFPKISESSGILTDKDREELESFGIKLAPGNAERAFEQFRTVHNVICSAEEGLYISSSTVGERGDENPESSIVSRIRKTYPQIAVPISLFEARMRAKVPFFDESVASHIGSGIWKNDESFAEKLRVIEENSQGKRGPILDKDNIEALFGKEIRLSASKADLYTKCRYAYFVQYGLGVSARERAEIKAVDAGTLMHDVLENVFRTMKGQEIDEERAATLAGELCRKYIEEKMKSDGDVTARMEFFLKRIEGTVVASVRDICRELEKSKFRPNDFELKFSASDGDLPPVSIESENCTVSLRGSVDRVDTYEEDGRLYFRVVDYKSGSKDFKLDKVLNGLDTQMLLYMFAIEEMAQQHYGRSAIPTGVMYVKLNRGMAAGRDGVVKPMKREGAILRDMNIIEAMESGDKEYIPVLVKKDGSISESKSTVLRKSEFDRVKSRVKDILADIGEKLNSGEIEPNPFEDGKAGSCEYCDYRSICAFDTERGGDSFRNLYEMKKEEILDVEEGETNE